MVVQKRSKFLARFRWYFPPVVQLSGTSGNKREQTFSLVLPILIKSPVVLLVFQGPKFLWVVRSRPKKRRRGPTGRRIFENLNTPTL